LSRGIEVIVLASLGDLETWEAVSEVSVGGFVSAAPDNSIYSL
jgi:hypothetical protein